MAKKAEEAMLNSPTWSHRKHQFIAKPFNDSEKNFDNDLKVINNKRVTKRKT